MKKKLKLISVLFPILVLSGLVAKTEFDIRTGFHFRVPIKGYDPRDLLRGQFLLFKYDWDFVPEKTKNFLVRHPHYQKEDVRLCVTEDFKVYPILEQDIDQGCKARVVGSFVGDVNRGDYQFDLGIEKFYLDENYAKELEGKLRLSEAEVELSVNTQGRAVLIDLFLDGRSWKELIEAKGP